MFQHLILFFVASAVADKCSGGNYRCSGDKAFEQCSNGQWFKQNCPTGTVCVQASATLARCEKIVAHDCEVGTYRCAGDKSFEQCSNGRWIKQNCAPGTGCRQSGRIIICDSVALTFTHPLSPPSKYDYKDDGHKDDHKDASGHKEDVKGVSKDKHEEDKKYVVDDHTTVLNNTHPVEDYKYQAPVDYGKCTNGAKRCDTDSSYEECKNGKWVHTTCKSDAKCVATGKEGVQCLVGDDYGVTSVSGAETVSVCLAVYGLAGLLVF